MSATPSRAGTNSPQPPSEAQTMWKSTAANIVVDSHGILRADCDTRVIQTHTLT